MRIGNNLVENVLLIILLKCKLAGWVVSAPDKDGVIAISKHPPNDFNEAKNAPQTILSVRKQLVSPFRAKLRTDPLIVRGVWQKT